MPDEPGNLAGRAVFGSFDGATSLVGVLFGLLATGAKPHTILAVSAGLAVAAMVGMAGGDYLGGASRREAIVMGLATLGGSFLPAIPVVLAPNGTGYMIAGSMIYLLGAGIAHVRGGGLHAYLTTFAILLTASVLAAGAAIIS